MTEAIQHLINELGNIPPLAIYGFVFVWLAAESCGLPLPNELVLLAAGSLAAQHSRHSVSPVVLVILATAGSVLGASAAYEIGRRGGRAAVLRFGRYIRLDEARLDTVERWFERAGPLAIGIARVTPFIRTIASFPAGMLRLPFRTFLVAVTLGSLVWCTVMVTLGVLLGANYVIALRLIERYTIPAIIVIVGVFVGYLWIHRRIARLSEGRRQRADTDASDSKSQRDKPV
jgi:membrane protein DedA with SNARE-associated domain